jgi:hypothetical protein
VFLDDPSIDPVIFDFGQVGGISPFDFSYEAHGVYIIHHAHKCQVPDHPKLLDFPMDFGDSIYSVHFLG